MDEDTQRGGDILLVDCLDDSRLVRVGLGNGVLMNNCSHIEGLNIPAIGFTLAISYQSLKHNGSGNIKRVHGYMSRCESCT